MYGQICTADVLSFSWQQGPSVEGRCIQICFLVEGKRPSVLSRKCTRETLEDDDASTNSLFVLVGCLNKHQAPDMALLWSGQLSPSTISKIKIIQLFWRASILITVPGIYPNEDKNMFCMQFNVCTAQWRKAIALWCHTAVVEEVEVIYWVQQYHIQEVFWLPSAEISCFVYLYRWSTFPLDYMPCCVAKLLSSPSTT